MKAPNAVRTFFASDSVRAAGCALIGLLAAVGSAPASLWEWDEVLFARSLHVYDLAFHSPHPPGFPLYVFAARAMRIVAPDDLTALSLVGFVFAALLGASAYLFFREAFADRDTAAAAAVLLVLAPAVLVYAGAPRSDVPGLSAGLFASALALRGRRSPRALAAAGLVLGLGFGVRVTVLAAAGPVFLAVILFRLKRRDWKVPALAASLAALGAAAVYLPVVIRTGFHRYFEIVRNHAIYTSSTDTIFASNEYALLPYRLERFFVDVWGGPGAARIALFLAAAGAVVLLIRRRRALGLMALAFLPVLAFSLVYMTPLAGPLYALPFLPLFTGLAAAALVPPSLPAGSNRPGLLRRLRWPAAAAAAAASVVWTAPAVALRSLQESPPWQAAVRIAETRDPLRSEVYYDELFLPYIHYLLGEYRSVPWLGEIPHVFNLIDPESSNNDPVALTAAPARGQFQERFSWAGGRGGERLRLLSLGRLFEAYITDLKSTRNIIWLDGWADIETDGVTSWRWMGRRSRSFLFIRAGAMVLRLRAMVLPEALPPEERATIVVRIDGRELERLETGRGVFDREWTIRTDPEASWLRLEIESDRTLVPAEAGLNDDSRTLGLQVFDLDWSPAEGRALRTFGLEDFTAGGWYPPERSGRWTGAEAFLRLPAIEGDARLDLIMEVPAGRDGTRARVTLEVDGREVDAFDPSDSAFLRTVNVPFSVHGGDESLLRFQVDRLVPDRAFRNLGLCVHFAGWTPAGFSPRRTGPKTPGPR